RGGARGCRGEGRRGRGEHGDDPRRSATKESAREGAAHEPLNETHPASLHALLRGLGGGPDIRVPREYLGPSEIGNVLPPGAMAPLRSSVPPSEIAPALKLSLCNRRPIAKHTEAG